MRFTKEEELEICKKYINERLMPIKLAEIYNCSKKTIIRIILKNQLENRKNSKLTPTEKTNIKKEFRNSKSINELAIQYNTSRSTISRIINKKDLYYIYIITKKDDNRSYIGQSINPNNRLKEHQKALNCKKQYIDRAIKKYGSDSFIYEIIEELPTQEDVNLAEQFWISYLNTRAPNGFNLTNGGDSVSGEDHPNFGKPSPCRLFSDEEELKICTEYLENENHDTSTLAKIYNCKNYVINNILKRNDIILRPRKIFNLEGENKIREEYLIIQSIEKLANKYNVSGRTICRILDKGDKEFLNQKKLVKEFSKKRQGYYGKEKREFLTEAQKTEMIKLYIENKLSSVEISKIYNCSSTLVYSILNKNGIKTRTGYKTNLEEEKNIILDYQNGYSAVKVGKKYNLSESTVLRIIKRNKNVNQ